MRSINHLFIATAIGLGACQTAVAPVQPVRLVETLDGRWPDECSSQEGFLKFLQRLTAAVAQHDVDLLMPLLARDVISSHGGDAGEGDFRSHWKLDDPKTSSLWAELSTVMSLGCGSWSEESLAMPAYMVRLPEDLDLPSMVVAVRPALVRARPSQSAKVLATLPMGAIIPFEVGQDLESVWTRVFVNGRRGWVRTTDFRALFSYRAHFGRENGEWKLKSFVAGD